MAKIKSGKNGTKKEVIIDKATRLFMEKGFGSASMRDLAEHVGVEAASLYNHIQSKSEILQEICFEVANAFMSKIEEVDNNEKTALKKIEVLLRFHVQQMVNEYEKVYVSDREWKYLSDPYLSNYQAQRRTYRKRMASMIKMGFREMKLK